MSCMQFYAYRFMLRPHSFNHWHRCMQLFSQFAVDMYVKMESERLAYLRTHQQELRAESYIHLRDAINNDADTAQLGQLCILPATFTAGPRYMHARTQDAMIYVRHYGRPDLFITFTCNPRWPEVQEQLLPDQSATHRHDILARVFRLKIAHFTQLVMKSRIFGAVRCYIYTVEWQKRGLPHAHFLFWLQTKIHANEIDSIVCAELPDPDVDGELFDIVKKHMVHGPCGFHNSKSPCMKDGKCCKRYPKPFVKETQTGQDGYPSYRRRSPQDGGVKTKIGRHDVDNRWIVPYCPWLTKSFDAHINVEFCHSVKSIKYICKYINKGSDAAMFNIDRAEARDEITQYQLGRYVSTNEAFWRIFGFPIHERYPPVQTLAVHLENGQRVYFTPQTAAQQACNPKETTLTAFFALCRRDPFARTLFYDQVPSYYRWTANQWVPRKNGAAVPHHPHMRLDATLGRVYTVHPNYQECFFLRLLLHQVRGPTSFADLRFVDGQLCDSYREACLMRGLLENDAHWDATMAEAATSRTAAALRLLFAILLTTCNVAHPMSIWLRHRDDLAEDFKRRLQRTNPDVHIDYTDDIYNLALIALEDKTVSMNGQRLTAFGLPATSRTQHTAIPSEITKEMSYDTDDLKQYIRLNVDKLQADQRRAYDAITDNVSLETGDLFFLDAPGGTGKTFLNTLLLANVRQHRHIALAVASSGVAATLLPGGRTVHSTFKLPLDLTANDIPTCTIGKTAAMAQVIRQCRLIVWDECSMAHRKALEAVDRTLRDLRDSNSPMGGITVVLSGDFRQTLPVVPKGTKADQLLACLKSSPLWPAVRSLRLSTNMRARLSCHPLAEQFTRTLLQLGEGKTPVDNNDMLRCSAIGTAVSSPAQLVDKVFPDLPSHIRDHNWLRERAILAPRNVTVDAINHTLLQQIEAPSQTYTAINTVVEENDAVNYPVEFLNSLETSGLPPHELRLKPDAPIILLRNLDQSRLCNGTRLAVKNLMPHVIKATILTGCGAGETVFVPRIPHIPSDLPFRFKRLQFPLRLSFAMSINKAQGQTLSVVGLQLEEPCFSHGQLYVGCSRTGNPDNLFIHTPTGDTKNIVHSEVFGTFLPS